MKRYSTCRRSALISSVIVLVVFLLTKCIDKQKEETAEKSETPGARPRADWSQYAGSASCAACHKNVYEDHMKTAHYLTSQPASAKFIKGSFDSGKNSFVFNNRVTVMMEKQQDSFYQVAYLNGEEKHRRQFDIVVGSGTKGQSYLNWSKNALFQLPITFFTPAQQWSNSPGYPDKVVFNRPITSRCLECHSTYVQTISDSKAEPELFDRGRIVYGVDCEKCHGPAAKHVEFQKNHPTDTAGDHIINPRNLSRQQNLDLCALCHGGRLNKTKPSFGFIVGDKLTDYFSFDTVGRNVADIDVHGNQFGLLAASKCFQGSEMTCTSCHNPHKNEKGKLEVMSTRCRSCHSSEHGKLCKMTATIGSAINKNCIDCHMPKQASRSIAVLLQESRGPTPVLMRTHLIKIYPDETKKFLSRLKKGSLNVN